MTPPLKGMIFDLDGTLVDSLSTTLDAFNHAIISLGGPEHTPQEIMRHFGAGETQIFSKLVGPENAEEAYAKFSGYLDSRLGQVRLHEGVPELLERIRTEKIPISIVTGRSWEMTELILKHHGILDRFVTVVADDHVSSPKPSPEGLKLALSRMALAPEEALFVGDSWADVCAARSAGTLGVACTWDLLADREILSQYEPHHWIETPEQLWAIWDERR